MAAARKYPSMHDLEIRIKSRKPAPPADDRPIRERAADYVADNDAGYVKKGMKMGTVDPGVEGVRASSRGSFITQNPVAGIGAGDAIAMDNFFAAISEALNRRPGAVIPHSELTIPRPSKRRSRGSK